MRLAAIDIGSNAARLLITEVKHTQLGPEFIKLNLIRVPLRLGFDVFTTGQDWPRKAHHDFAHDACFWRIPGSLQSGCC